MPFAFTLLEPRAADYIHIDDHNVVHLLLPISSGTTIGLDNTCKSTLELEKFLGARAGEKSAFEVLCEYEAALVADITTLRGLGYLPELLALKESRLRQIRSYKEILQIVVRPLYHSMRSEGHHFSFFPQGINNLLQRQTNCLSMRLSPMVPDSVLRADYPVFSLKRSLGSGFAAILRDSLQYLPTTLVRPTPKQQLIDKAVAHFSGIAHPPLEDLQAYIEREIAATYGEAVTAKKAQDGTSIDASYISAVIGVSAITELSTPELIDFHLNAAFSEDFWAGKTDLFALDARRSPKEADRLSMIIQFLLAEINLFCHVKGKTKANFGTLFDSDPDKAELVRQITEAFNAGRNIAHEIFSVINSKYRKLGMAAPLTREEEEEIYMSFQAHFKTIQESPHFDEFTVFFPEERGDFFNHHGKIAAHFLDVVMEQGLSPVDKARVTDFIVRNHLNFRSIKESPLRSLPFQNNVFNPNLLEKLARPLGGAENKELILNNDNWLNAIASLETLTRSYKKRFVYLFKGGDRKVQISELERLTEQLKACIRGTDVFSTRVQALTTAFTLFASIIATGDARSTMIENVTKVKEHFLTLFTLQNAPLVKNPENPVSEVFNFERALLGDLASFPVFHDLKAAWWQDATTLAILHHVPDHYYTSTFVKFLNSINPTDLDACIVHVLREWPTPINLAEDSILTKLQAQYQLLALLGERRVAEALRGFFTQLKSAWWVAAKITQLVTLFPLTRAGQPSLPELLEFFNHISPDDIDEDILRALRSWPTKLDLVHPERLATLRQQGQLLALMESKHLHAWLQLSMTALPATYWTAEKVALLAQFAPANRSEEVKYQIYFDLFKRVSANEIDADVVRALKSWPLDRLTPFASDLPYLREQGRFLALMEQKNVNITLRPFLAMLERKYWNAEMIDKAVLYLENVAIKPSLRDFSSIFARIASIPAVTHNVASAAISTVTTSSQRAEISPRSQRNSLSAHEATRLFHIMHTDKLHADKRRGCFGFFRRTVVKTNFTLVDILHHAMAYDNRSRKVCIDLGWLTKDGSVPLQAPEIIKETAAALAQVRFLRH